MPVCPKCRVAYLDGESHECSKPIPPTVGGATFATRNVVGMFVPLLTQAVFTGLFGAIFSKAKYSPGLEGLVYLSFGVSAVTGLVLFTRKWTPGARFVLGLFYCPLIVVILVYEHFVVWMALFSGESF